MAKKKINNTFRDKFLSDHNIRPEYNLFKHYVRDSLTETTVSEIFRGDVHGNMLIYYPTLDLRLATHHKQGVEHDSYRVRYKVPFINSKGDLTKYTMEGKNRIFFPPEMINAYVNKQEIETLVITEGEKKAFVACKNGWDCVGISGIWNFGRDVDDDPTKQKELMPELKEFMNVCKVKNVVMLHDSDCLDISTKYFNQASNKSATERPMDFFECTKRLGELLFQEGYHYYHSYINPNLTDSKLGLDDLIKKFETHAGTFDGVRGVPVLLADFIEGVKFNKFTSYFITRQIQYTQNSFLKSIFKINDPDDFYQYHKALFKKHELKQFRFDNKTFEIDHVEKKIKEVKVTEFKAVWVNKGRYHGINLKGEEKIISNFTMNVLFLLKSANNPKRIIEFENILGQKFVRELSMDDLVSVTGFRKNLIAHGSFIFKGDMPELLNLQEMLFRDEKVATELTSLGWQKNFGFYAFANGITLNGKFFPVDEYGVVSHHNEKFYIPAFSNLHNNPDDNFDNEKKFSHKASDVTFEQWSKQFYTVYGNNGAVAMCFGISALFYDIVFKKLDMFPILNCFGIKGSGKSTITRSLMYLFGEPQKAISLESESSTKKGTYRKFMQFRNAIVWLDEYKNTIDKRTIGQIKGLFDGHGYEKAQTTQDNRTHSTSIYSAAMISGQDMPTTEEALLSRVILLQFIQTKFNEAESANMKILQELEEKSLTSITIALLGQRDLIAGNLETEYNIWYSKFSADFKTISIDTRSLKSATSILSPVAILVKNKIIQLPYSLEELYAKFVTILKYQKEIASKNSSTQVFWEVVGFLYNDKEISIQNGDFRFVQDCVAFKMTDLYFKYARKFRELYGKNGIDKSTLINYLENSAAFKGVKKQLKFNGQNTSGYLFDYKMLGINLMNDNDPQEEPIPSEAKIQEDTPDLVTSNGDEDELPI